MHNPFSYILILINIIASTTFLYSKESISGVIRDAKSKETLVGVNIVVQGSSTGTITDIDGHYSIDLPPGKYNLELYYIGYKSITEPVTISGDKTKKDFYLTAASKELDEVVVISKGLVQQKRELPFHVSVIDAKPLQAQSQPVTTLINQISGVRVREQGGMGSNCNIMLNGIGGKGVKVFVDEVPVYLLGAGFSLNTLSPNMIEHIEVYKGTIPVEFGSDALGGIINVVSRNRSTDYVDMSYSYGSWNTQIASLNARKKFGPDEKCFVKIDGLYNHSDNDYWMDDVEILIPDDPNHNTQTGSAQRFNDQFTSLLLRLQTGIRNIKWADELILIASYSYLYKEWQHGVWAEQVWGEPNTIQQSENASVSWKKAAKNNKWNIKIFAGYTYDKMHTVDTARKSYYWDQNYLTTINGGETGYYSNGTSPLITTQTWFSRESFNYSLNSNHTLNLTTLLTNDDLNVSNELLLQDEEDGEYPPQNLLKNYTGLALASELFEKKLKNTISAKHFYMQSSGVSLLYDNTLSDREDNNFSTFGYGDVIQYQFGHILTVNLGYEYTVRQPDNEEIFGNYITVVSNPSLNPETSHNVNFGTEFNTTENRFKAGASFFYRNTNNRIYLSAVSSTAAKYDNLYGTRTLGTEFHTEYRIIRGLKASINATYQDITLQKTTSESQLTSYIGERIPNTPYLFGNGQLIYSKEIKKLGNGRITMGYDFNYVHEFFLTWTKNGREETKDIIPTQALHNINLSWMAPRDRWSIGVECRNLTNAEAYDNFSVQLPGRSFYVKTRLLLDKNYN